MRIPGQMHSESPRTALSHTASSQKFLWALVFARQRRERLHMEFHVDLWMHVGTWTPWLRVCSGITTEKRNCDRYETGIDTDILVVVWLNKQRT